MTIEQNIEVIVYHHLQPTDVNETNSANWLVAQIMSIVEEKEGINNIPTTKEEALDLVVDIYNNFNFDIQDFVDVLLKRMNHKPIKK